MEILSAPSTFKTLYSAGLTHTSIACLAADSFPFSGGAEIKKASEKRASDEARLA